MAKVVYKIVKHEDGWAYKARGTFSERLQAMTRLSRRRGIAAGEQKFRARRSASNTRRPTASGMRRSILARTGPRPESRTIESAAAPPGPCFAVAVALNTPREAFACACCTNAGQRNVNSRRSIQASARCSRTCALRGG